MIWLNPAALFALAAVAAPILIHILVQRRAERFAFPTLRFLQPTRLAAIRRHLLEDLSLLAIRAALLAAAVAALAGPLLVTAARRQAWDRRLVRAIVIDDGASAVQRRQAEAAPERLALQRTFEGASLPDGIRRAVLWLESAPPARREVVIQSPLPIGSMTGADVAAIPAGIGVRFERTGTLPPSRTVPAGRLLTPTTVNEREVTLTGDWTSLRDTASGDRTTWPIDIVSSNGERPAVDAAIAAVLSQHVWAAPPDRRARLVLVERAGVVPAPSSGDPAAAVLAEGSPMQRAWMARAAARMARDAELRSAAMAVASGLSDQRFSAAPWQRLASAADGRPLAAGAGSANGLIVASAAPASDLATPLLLRSMANAIADRPDLQGAEIVPVDDEMLQRWSRPAAPVTSPRMETVERDDRRWLWIAVLSLLALEAWVRRQRPAGKPQSLHEERARVA